MTDFQKHLARLRLMGFFDALHNRPERSYDGLDPLEAETYLDGYSHGWAERIR